MNVLTKSSKETQKVAGELAKKLKGDEVLALYGNLGSGKTTFIQGLAKALGVKERIISPTFIIIREHKFSTSKFYHVDLYRVQEKDMRELELKEILNRKDRIVAIEWAEKIEDILPKERIEVHFEQISENERRIKVQWMR